MSYFSDMKGEMEKDIERCNELLKEDYVEEKEFSDIKVKYKTIYPNFAKILRIMCILEIKFQIKLKMLKY